MDKQKEERERKGRKALTLQSSYKIAGSGFRRKNEERREKKRRKEQTEKHKDTQQSHRHFNTRAVLQQRAKQHTEKD